MDLSFKKINMLPEPTWRSLQVNDTEIAARVPDIMPYVGRALTGTLPDGVEWFDDEALQTPTGMGTAADQFAAAHRNAGVSLKVRAGVKVAEPVFLFYKLDEKNRSVVDYNTIFAEEGSEITVVMRCISQGEGACFHGGVTRIHAAKNAAVHLIQVQTLNHAGLNFDDVGACAEENARIDVVQAELGGARTLAGCRARLAGADSRLEIDTIYFGDGGRDIDINYVAEHSGKRSKSDIRVNGALLDSSRKTFRGTIDFKQGARQAAGHEREYNLLFGPNVRSRTAPLILCGEEDVEGQHAATSGKVDEAKLFYLMSRGLSELDAKKLMIEAQFLPAVNKIPQESLRNAIFDYVKERLESVESLSE